jgi:putative nucleotidyltransferase with HDIG domain
LKFKRILIAGFFGLLLLFFYFQRNLTKKIVSPLEELIGMVQVLTGQEVVFSLRSAEDDEIKLIKTYMLQLQNSIHDRDMKLRRYLFSVMDVLIDLLEIKDSYTASHSKEVRKYSIAIAQMMGLPEQEVRDIAFAATLHDIGKIGVSHTILNKPGKLTLQEFSIIKQHPVVADEVLKNIEELEYIRKIIRHHHEKYDGTGYPDKLLGNAIPLAARVVSVADSFDAMTSDRPYRKALSYSEAMAILLEEKGRQFDPQVVDALVKYLYQQDLFEVERIVASS